MIPLYKANSSSNKVSLNMREFKAKYRSGTKYQLKGKREDSVIGVRGVSYAGM